MSEIDFERDTEIDEDALEVEWLRQSSLHARYAKRLIDANDRVRRLEQRMKVVRSDLILDAQENPEKCLGKDIKPTGANVEAYYRTHEDYQEAKKKYFEALKDVDSYQHGINALQTKKVALENLVKLYIAGYFSGPKEPHDISREFRERVQNKREEEIENQRHKEVRHRTRTK